MKAIGWLLAVVGLCVGGVLLGRWAGPTLARTHYAVQLADELRSPAGAEPTKTIDAFRRSGRTTEDLFKEADRVEAAFGWGSELLGLWIGLVSAAVLWGTLHRRPRSIAVIDHASCVSCGRCFASCPRERLRWKANTVGSTEPLSGL